MAALNMDELNEAVKTPKKAAGKNLVTIRVPRKENEKVMIVGDNGKYYKLKRGAEVEVPQSVANIIEESEKRTEAMQDLIDKLSNE